MEFEEKIIPAKDSYPLAIRIYSCENPKAVIKFIHGMEEHQGRYEDFASFLCSNGYIVVTADLRGHGRNAKKLSHISDKNGHKLLIEDEQVIREFIQDTWPDLPKYLFAHSMGTIIARVYLQTQSNKYSKLVLSGYPNPQHAAAAGIVISSLLRGIKGPEDHSKLLVNLSLGAYAKSIKDRKTLLDWISYNEDNIAAYDKDPLSGEDFTIASYNALFHLVNELFGKKNIKGLNKEMPILLLAGIDDACVGGEKGRKTSKKVLEKQGFTNIQTQEFEHMRHEILNEKDNKKVYQIILNFYNKK